MYQANDDCFHKYNIEQCCCFVFSNGSQFCISYWPLPNNETSIESTHHWCGAFYGSEVVDF